MVGRYSEIVYFLKFSDTVRTIFTDVNQIITIHNNTNPDGRIRLSLRSVYCILSKSIMLPIDSICIKIDVAPALRDTCLKPTPNGTSPECGP